MISKFIFPKNSTFSEFIFPNSKFFASALFFNLLFLRILGILAAYDSEFIFSYEF